MTPTASTAETPTSRKRARSVTVHNVSWDAYEKLVEAFDETPKVRLTYDRGVLEITVPSLDHDNSDRTVMMFVVNLAKGFGGDFWPGGGTTMKRKKMLKGAEADEIFWLANAPAMIGATALDLESGAHPPPDLAIEVDVTRSSAKRLCVLAAIGIPEVWRKQGDELTFLGRVGKKYVEIDRSRSFPLLSAADLVPFLHRARTEGKQLALYDEVFEWARERAKASSEAGGESAGG